MPIPYKAKLAKRANFMGQVAIEVGSIAWQAAISAVAGSFTAPLARGAMIRTNRESPNTIPPVDLLIQSFYRGMMPEEALRDSLLWHGISIEDHARNASLHDWWKLCIHAAAPCPPIDTVIDMHRFYGRVPIGDVAAEQTGHYWLKRNGIWSREWRDYLLDVSDPFSMEELLFGYHVLGWTEAFVNKQLKRNGYLGEQDRDIFWRASETLPVTGILDLLNRGKLEAGEYESYMKRLGYYLPRQRDLAAELAKQIPGPSDLVDFKVREVWDADVVQAFGYDDEYNENDAYVRFMTAQGMGWDIRQEGDPPGGPKTWAQAHWRRHWRQLAPQLSFTMFHRLRGDPDNPATWRVPGIKPFTLDDVKRVLKINDYPPVFRDRLAAISFSLIGLRQLRQFIDTATTRKGFALSVTGNEAFRAADQVETDGDVVGARERRIAVLEPEIVERYMDRGLTRPDATLLAKTDLRRAADKGIEQEGERIVRLQKRFVADTLRRYRLGLVDHAGARQLLEASGWGEQSIALALASERAAAEEAVARAGISRIRGDFMTGRSGPAVIVQRLTDMGVTDNAAQWYLAKWTAARGMWAKTLSAGQILSAAASGIVPLATARQALFNLSWPDPDNLVLIAGAAQRLDRLQANRERAALASREKAARQLQAAVKQAEAEKRKIQADLRRLTPISWLKNQYASGRIGDEYFTERLDAMGEPSDVIALELADARDRAKQAEGKRRKVTHTVKRTVSADQETSTVETTAQTKVIDPGIDEVRIDVSKRDE